ncbi:MAG: glycoside hydrolase family 1 protein [Candidatus Pacebacteria bacterium]|nr:glycoside hydrolase family 1 protein [Candidatus Paceibacterota bacterium]
MPKQILKFPKDFLWGSSVSSYQVEGGNVICDWSEKFPAKTACNYYLNYEHFFDLAKELNQNVHRFSLSWARIQPAEGKFDRKAIEHYRKMLLALKERDIKSMVTIWHWTLPLWMSEKGGWENSKFADYFQQYTKFVVEELDDLVDFWMTTNEPMIYTSLSYILGKFPPQKNNLFLAPKVINNFVKTHKKAYECIHDINKNAKVGVAQNLSFGEPFNNKSILNRSVAKTFNFFRNSLFLELTKNHQDFLGINYYFHDRIKITPFSFPFAKIKNDDKEVSDLNWEIYPKGIYHVLNNLKKYNLPIYITENGLADEKDQKREKFIKQHLRYIHKAIKNGADVRGYMHWSLIDNFEWRDGYGPRFGLVEMNYKDMSTKIRPSALEYAKICKTGVLEN